MIKFAMLCRPGERENNEDSIGVYHDKDEWCFALADGLGGHRKGEIASETAVDAAVETFASGVRHRTYIESAFENAQKAIRVKQKQQPECHDMKTTMVLLTVENDKVIWGHIGDSRLYYFENKKIQKRTLDHSVPQMLVMIGEIKEKEIRHHPDRNRLLRVLGVEINEHPYEVERPYKRQKKQQFLLCSDGFWELIDEKRMQSTLKNANDPREWLTAMEVIVNKNGKGTNMDNYSAIAVWIE